MIIPGLFLRISDAFIADRAAVLAHQVPSLSFGESASFLSLFVERIEEFLLADKTVIVRVKIFEVSLKLILVEFSIGLDDFHGL